jgi:hypothetical protein
MVIEVVSAEVVDVMDACAEFLHRTCQVTPGFGWDARAEQESAMEWISRTG